MKKVDLTQGTVWRVLVALALPIMGGSLLQFTYNLIDMLWVGRLGSDAVASIGSASFFIGLGYAINALVVIGTGIKVAHSVGKKDEHAIKVYVNNGTVINAVLGIVFGALLIIGGRSFIRFLNMDSGSVIETSYSYLAWSAPMMFFAFFNLLYTRLFGSFGNNKVAFWISAVGICINIVLDPILIYTLGLGVKGAAIATLIGNIVMFLMFLKVAWKQLRFDFEVGLDWDAAKEICKLGFPMAFQRVLFTIVNIILARMIGAFGAHAIAAQKIGLQIESVAFMIVGGLNGAMASFAGQNFGAKKFRRIHEGYHTALAIGISYAMLMGVVLWTIPGPLARLFVDDAETIRITIDYLKVVSFGTLFAAIEMVSNGVFTGIGLPKIPATISIVFTVMRIPLAMGLITYFGVTGVWLAIGISSILKGSMAYIIYKLKVGKKYAHVR